MAKEPAIRSLTIQNLLSFGPEPTTVELRNLNVLIGPNGSGKSNLIEVLGLLHSAPDELARAMSKGGPIDEWLWKGTAGKSKDLTASVETVAPVAGRTGLRYGLSVKKGPGYRLEIADERIEDESPLGGTSATLYYSLEGGHPHLRSMLDPLSKSKAGAIGDFDPHLSILAQRKAPLLYPQLSYIRDLFAGFRLHRDWEFGTSGNVRDACDATLQNEYLEDDYSNFGVVLDRLLSIPSVHDQIVSSLQTLYEGASDLRTNIEGGRVQVRLFEKHLRGGTPLVRLSDGTLRWLTLLAILLNPDPPPLVCIEEPELGLHPDMIHELGNLLKEASTRMQLIITTHSDRLVEEFTDTPEAVVVCEKENGASKFRRLDRKQLASWLEDYTLGQIWTRGQIGGTRW